MSTNKTFTLFCEKRSIAIHVSVMNCISVPPNASVLNHVSKIDITPCHFYKTNVKPRSMDKTLFASTNFETASHFLVLL